MRKNVNSSFQEYVEDNEVIKIIAIKITKITKKQ